MGNCVVTTKKLLELLGVKYTKSYVEDTILSHPEHPSLLCISDTLEKYAIEHLAVKIDADKLLEMPLPGIVQISERGNKLFYTLHSISNEKVDYYNDKGKLIEDPKEEFLEKWTGVCLLAEKTEASKEVDIEKKLASQRFLTFLKVAVPTLLLIWLIVDFYNLPIYLNSTTTLLIATYALLKTVGLTICGLLLWFEIDQYNPTLQSFCSGGSGSKINCDSVLNSKYAQFFDGYLSLSLLGFSYFFASLGSLAITGFSSSLLALSGFFSLATLPFILASAYYQAMVIKQWCRFCILVQTVLVFEIGVVLIGDFNNLPLSFDTLPLFLALLLSPLLVWKLIKPLLEKKKETNVYKRGLKRIKNNPDVLHGLLAKSRKILSSTEGLGISLNTDTANYNVINVCNPYCGPCAEAHPILEKLAENGNINLQILFTASNHEEDITAKPVRQFLAIDANGDKSKIKEALNEWYSAEKKDYESFASRYPMNGELEQQEKKIAAMRQWCNTENITHTPTLFINGYELPNEYSVEDLKEVLA